MIVGVLLVIVVSLFRLHPLLMNLGIDQPAWIPNFSPMAAICLCTAACLPRRLAVALPFVVLIGTDFLLNWHFSQVRVMTAAQTGQTAVAFSFFSLELLAKTLAFAAISFFGWQLRKQPRAKVLIPAAIGSSLFFYLVTNTASWLTDPGYSGSLSSWAQALTTGLPQYAPTWQFYRNTFVSDMLFTVLFLASIRVRPPLPQGSPQAAAAW